MAKQEERRRYFRIDDTVCLQFEVLSEADARERELELRRVDFGAGNRLQLAERQLQLLIDKLRVQNPEVAEAIELLNTKFSILKNEQMERDQRDKTGARHVRQVSISACGISFDERDRLDHGAKLCLDITLLPSDLHVRTMGELVDCRESENDSNYWRWAVDFYGLSMDDEELMVQHVVKRQGRLLAQKRQA